MSTPLCGGAHARDEAGSEEGRLSNREKGRVLMIFSEALNPATSEASGLLEPPDFINQLIPLWFEPSEMVSVAHHRRVLDKTPRCLTHLCCTERLREHTSWGTRPGDLLEVTGLLSETASPEVGLPSLQAVLPMMRSLPLLLPCPEVRHWLTAKATLKPTHRVRCSFSNIPPQSQDLAGSRPQTSEGQKERGPIVLEAEAA